MRNYSAVCLVFWGDPKLIMNNLTFPWNDLGPQEDPRAIQNHSGAGQSQSWPGIFVIFVHTFFQYEKLMLNMVRMRKQMIIKQPQCNKGIEEGVSHRFWRLEGEERRSQAASDPETDKTNFQGFWGLGKIKEDFQVASKLERTEEVISHWFGRSEREKRRFLAFSGLLRPSPSPRRPEKAPRRSLKD